MSNFTVGMGENKKIDHLLRWDALMKKGTQNRLARPRVRLGLNLLFSPFLKGFFTCLIFLLFILFLFNRVEGTRVEAIENEEGAGKTVAYLVSIGSGVPGRSRQQ